MAYLTFDDGPSEWTDQFLDILAESSVPATFFLTAYGVRAHGYAGYSPTIRRIVSGGHALGNHTLHHWHLTGDRDNAWTAKRELDCNRFAINTALGVEPSEPLDLIRPPFGEMPGNLASAIKARGFNAIWNLDSLDSRGWARGEWFCDYTKSLTQTAPDCAKPSTGSFNLYNPGDPEYLAKVERITRTVLDQALGQGIVVLMHDTHPTSRDALPGIIDGLKAKNYVFQTIAQLRDSVYGPEPTRPPASFPIADCPEPYASP